MRKSAIRSKPGTTHLWTIQPPDVWDRLQREKSLLVDPHHPAFEKDLQPEYDWMRGQMARRITDYQGHYPWWAYDYRLDLRSFRFLLSQGPQVRLGLAIPTERVLLSAYGAWHYVLNRWYLPYSVDSGQYDQETEAWEEELRREGISPYGTLPEPWRSRQAASWERIFDTDDLRDTNTIQACFERLDLEDVFEVTTFIGVRR